FPGEIEALKSNRVISKTNIAALSPFLDQSGLIRIGGRIRRAELTFSQKHPILLPNRCHLTDCIIREIHNNNHHTGIQATLNILRQRFWLLDGRNQVRKVIRTCTRCSRFNAKAVEYKMGDLPPVRVRQAIPFSNTGVDFCGPFFIKEKKHRFIAALRRFIARRGLPQHIFSDNGTNFVRQDFWARWHKEYLNELQKRIKWVKNGPKIEVGTIVTIKDKNLPCMQWALGRILQVHPGEDGVVRVATVQTAAGVIKRSTSLLCPLPLKQ
ncbi:hypothetical protein ALC62_00105, partial [Cyphomyrmex costatus]